MKLSEIPPVRCSSCFGQYPDRRHVDFEAAWEGPTFKEGVMGDNGEVTNVIPVTVDDLIICENCMRAGAELLGLVDPEQHAQALESAEAQRDELLERVRGLELHNKNLEASLASKRELAGARG